MNLTRKTFLNAIVATALAAIGTPPVWADEWPAKPLTLIVPYPSGGFGDSVSRTVGHELSRILGQPVVIDNRAGASGRIGTDAIVRAPRDGYTIGMAVPAMLSLLPLADARYAQLNQQITPLTLAIRGEMAIAVNPARVPADSLQSFVAYARANKGKMAYASAGIGTSFHLWAEVISQALGIDAVHVPYKGESPAMTDLMGGQVQYMVVSGAAKPHVDSGKLKILATTGKDRWSVYPDAPTLAELGFGQVDASGWLGFIAPAGLPKGVADKLHDGLVRALKQPSVEKVLALQGYRVVASPPEALTAVAESEMAQFGKLIRSGRVDLR